MQLIVAIFGLDVATFVVAFVPGNVAGFRLAALTFPTDFRIGRGVFTLAHAFDVFCKCSVC